MELFRPLYWDAGKLQLLDQRLLPREEKWLTLETPGDVAAAIRDMAVRGAPAIGAAAGFGIALAFRSPDGPPGESLERAAAAIRAARPTARDLFAAVERMERAFARVEGRPEPEIAAAMEREALALSEEGIAACRAIGRFGAALLADGSTVLTHCNAGALATSGYGTALGVVRGAVESGKTIRVLADETRPFLQGARLTAWELHRDGIPVEIITDGMAGYYLASGEISAVVVGADRIAANGDAANKIGTYGLAVLAKENRIPFYVAAPTTTIDRSLAVGSKIPIENRTSAEVVRIGGVTIAPEGVKARHPAFDVTPARYITAIITERGVHRAPYTESLPR
ncbi:MAG TPA: S-methyl-5-thioribose-1-phosphate isomerase [Thermoanaerobaculia bacterium]|nr:S-methyl-5-thioribose-1-phosphate isomerase [Thermoanaerobaculia bacterium]